ncbi:MAG: serine/threonine-protein kinase [Pseudomonadota bacterium]
MDAEQFAKIEAIFHEVSTLVGEAQRNRAVELCQGDHDIEVQVLGLLEHSDSTRDWVDHVVTRAGDSLAAENPSLEGTTLGVYEVGEVIGEGGMGEVYAAVQTEPIEREVALKVIRPDRVSPRMLARFNAELSNLALMQHDSIAAVFDAGETPDGRPYFVMEKVSGSKLTQFCDELRLGFAERIDIFLSVCAAVQHAHLRGVIHRDLKPSNIIVKQQDDQIVAKVIDFGIAKAITDEGTDNAAKTVVGQILGSPNYMSPEQANARGAEVDVRADVYALGGVLYELLVGVTPLNLEQELGSLQQLTAIANTIPDRPSHKLRLAGRADKEAETYKALRSDLDWVILKALEKDPADRYRSVADFAADVQRHMDNQPVLAHPPGMFYELSKFSRRHPTGVSVSVASVLLLLIGFAGTLWGLQAAQQAEALADRRAASSEQAVSYLLDMFSNANPEFHQGDRITVEELIREAARDSGQMFAQEPSLRVDMQYRLAEVMSRMGNYQEAIELATQAWQADQVLPGFPSASTVQGIDTLVRTYLAQSRFAEGLEIVNEAQHLVTRLPEDKRGWVNAKLAYARANASFYLSGSKLVGLGLTDHDQSEAAELAQTAVDLFREVAPVSSEMADALDLVGYNLTYTPRNDEAFAPLQEALDIREELFGSSHTSLLSTLEHLSDALLSAGKAEESLPYIKRMRDIAESTYPPESPLFRWGSGQYATYLSETRQHQAAAAAWKEQVQHGATTDARGNYYNLLALQYLIGELSILGELDEAMLYLNQASDMVHQSQIEWGLARIYFGYAGQALLRGQVEETLRNLELGIELASTDYYIEENPFYQAIHEDPRFQKLIERHKEIVRTGTHISIAEHNRKYHAAP